MPTLIVCLSTLPLLYGLTGCKGTGSSGSQTDLGSPTGRQYASLIGPQGPAGPAGPVGEAGAVGATGAVGPAGVIGAWALYRDIRFEESQSALRASEIAKVAEIAKYLKANPSLRIGLDGTMAPRGSDPRDQKLSDQRVVTIRDALIEAGVPATSIQLGAFGDPALTADRRVPVLISTAK